MKNKTLKELFWFEFIINMILLMLCIGGLIVVIGYNGSIIQSNKNVGKLFFIMLIIGLAILLIFCIIRVVPFLRDIQYVKNNIYEQVKGTVIGFKKNQDVDSGVQINNKPIVKECETEKIFVFNVNDFLIKGQVYSFVYLKNTRIAVINDET